MAACASRFAKYVATDGSILEQCSRLPHLDAQEPFVDLRVEFVNATVFELTLDRVQGRIQYRDNLLQRAPEIVNGGVARHGEWFTVDVRQWLLPETAQRMRDELPVTLKTGNCAFMFRFEDETGAAQTMRCAFPDGIFRVSKS